MEVAKECFVGSSAAVLATCVSNPFDYAKTKMQLQGELQKAGTYTTAYRNIPDVIIKTIKTEGVAGVQSGLVAASLFQIIMNGSRLGLFQVCLNKGWINNPDGSRSFSRALLFGAIVGAISSYLSSPAYMIRAQMQAASSSDIKVGLHQRQKVSFYRSYRMCLDEVKIHEASSGFDYARRWVISMWRGCHITAMRLIVGSSTQLSFFSMFEEFYEERLPNMKRGALQNSILTSITASAITAVVINPFDLVATRVLNQPTDPVTMKGRYYHSIRHCFISSYKAEGILGFYKGLTAQLYRVGVHVSILLILWRQIHKLVE